MQRGLTRKILQTDLRREAILTAPDHIWVADITYIRLAEEFV
ncbi:MAG: hypothetical protein WAL59_07550 [Roseiarcus sp.]